MSRLNKQEVFGWMLSAFAVALFFPLRVPILVMLFVCVLMIVWSTKDDWRNLARNLTIVHWSLFLFFLVCTVTAIVHEKPGDAWKLIEMRLELLFLPLALALQHEVVMRPSVLKRLAMGFIAGSLIFTCYNFIGAIVQSWHFDGGTWYFDAGIEEGRAFFESISYGGNYFFSVHLSPNLHPTYASIYITLSLLFLWFVVMPGRKIQASVLLISAWLILHLFALSSRGAMLSVAMLILFIAIRYAVSTKILWLKIAMILAAILGLGAIALNPRFTNIMLNPAEMTEHNPRYYIWQVGWNLMGDHSLWGLGFSGLTDALLQGYRAMGYDYGYIEHYNLHNQYMETLLTSGVIGLTSLLFILYAFLRTSMRSGGSIVGIGLLIVIAVNLVFECLLNRFSGMAFISLFFPVVVFMAGPKPGKQNV